MLGLLSKSLSRFTAYVFAKLKECGTAFRIVGLLFSFQRPSRIHDTRPRSRRRALTTAVARTTGSRQRGSRSTVTPSVRQEGRRTGFRLEGALSFTSTPLRGQEASGNRAPFFLSRFGALLLTPSRDLVKSFGEPSSRRALCEKGAASTLSPTSSSSGTGSASLRPFPSEGRCF